MNTKGNTLLYLISGLLSLAVYLISYDFPFFWDTIQLGAKQGTHLYETGHWLLPDAIDSGHPPGFGAYLAMWWTVLGRSLWVSHLAMVPWVWLLIAQVLLLSRDLLFDKWWLMAPIILVEPVLLGQIVLVSPDVVLLAAFLLGVRQVCQGPDRNNFFIFLAAIVLALVSTRGWIAALVLYFLAWVPGLVHYYFSPIGEGEEDTTPSVLQFGIVTAFRALSLFLVAGILALTYLYLHYRAKGWVGYHDGSPWAGSFQQVGFSGVLKNIGLLGWRWLDVGRIMLWVLLPIAIFKHGWQVVKSSYVWWLPLAAAAFFQLLLAPLILSHNGLTAPRYLLPAIVFFDLWVVYTIAYHHIPFDLQGKLREVQLVGWQKVSLALAFIALATGNFWVYPQRIAQAWDATPAHLPYYAHERAAIDFLHNQGIPLDSVRTVFPSDGPVDFRELNGVTTGFSKNLALTEARCYFVSSIHNDWSDAELDFIEAKPILWEQRAWNGVVTTLYDGSSLASKRN